MADDETLLCWECVSDPVLRQWLENNGHVGKCFFCGKRRIACPLPMAAQEIDVALREYYRPAKETAHIVEESDSPQYWPDGESASEIIQQIAGVETEVADAIDAHMSDAEWHDVRDGDNEYYGGVLLEHIDAYPDEFMDVWLRFENRLKHEVRFFDDEGKRLLDEVFADLPTLAGGKAIVTLEPNSVFSTFYRARIVEGDAEPFIRYPAQQIGPPPPHLARAGRMNPIGIPVFYGAFSEAVAVAEVRPPVGAIVAVGKFSLLRAVKLLDISFLPFAYHQESTFSLDYDRMRNKVRFLDKFHSRISRPVLPSDEALEYLPTQAVAAYVANIMGLDGVIHASTQVGAEHDPFTQVDRTLCNVTLFGEAARVEGAQPERKPARDPVPPMFLPTLAPEVPELIDLLATQAGPEFSHAPLATPPHQEAEHPTELEFEEPPESAAAVATLRVVGEPKLVKITSVTMGTSAIFTHLYKDGKVIIDYHDDDDD